MVQPVDVDALVAQSVRNNESLGITGALITLEGHFLQYLEGPTDGVDALLEKLEADPRHSGLLVLERRFVSRRMFGDWRMARMVWNDDMAAIFRSFSPGARLDVREIDPSTCAPMFRAWLNAYLGRGPTLTDMNLT